MFEAESVEYGRRPSKTSEQMCSFIWIRGHALDAEGILEPSEGGLVRDQRSVQIIHVVREVRASRQSTQE